MILCGNSLYRGKQVKETSLGYWILVSQQKGKIWTQTHMEARGCEETQRKEYLKLGRGSGTHPSLTTSEGINLDLGVLSSRIVCKMPSFWVFSFLIFFFFCSFEGSITKLVCIVYLIFPHANPHCHPTHHQWASCWLFILKYLHRVWPITGTQWMLVTESPWTKWTSLNLPKLNWYSQLKSFGLYIVIFIKLMIVQER